MTSCSLVLRIWDVYPRSWIRLFSIPDPNFFNLGPRICIKEFNYFNPKKCFLNSRKYDPGCSSRIQIPDPDTDFLPIPDPGSRGKKGRHRIQGSKRHRIPDPQHCCSQFNYFTLLFSVIWPKFRLVGNTVP